MPKTNPDYLPPLGDAVTPNPGDIVVPQSPSGTITTDTGRTETSTQTFLSGVGPNVPQQGTSSLTSAPSIAGTPEIQWTNQVQEFNPFPGYGSQGNKFS
jgi:hypothetical protein